MTQSQAYVVIGQLWLVLSVLHRRDPRISILFGAAGLGSLVVAIIYA